MRVLMLGWEFPPHITGGLGTACHGLTCALSDEGVEVVFVVPHAHGDEDADAVVLVNGDDVEEETDTGGISLPAGMRLERVDADLRPYDGATVVRTPQSGGRRPDHYGTDLFSEVARYARKVSALAETEEFDVVHAHDWMTFPAGLAAARRAGVPLIIHVHSTEHDRAGPDGDERIRRVEQLGLTEADAVVCVSRYTANLLRNHYEVEERKLRVVHNGVPEFEAPNGDDGKAIDNPVVLFLGRITYQKGPGFFLEAAARVAEIDPRVKFVVAGSGDGLPAMVERAAELGLARRVHFTGFLRGDDVQRMYRQADVYVMPSVSEPFGISPLEAVAAGVPVIVSRQSGVAEVLREALKVDFWNVEDLADKILSVLRRPALRRHLAQGAGSEVQRLSWDAAARRVTALYDEFVQ
jgi:glycogen synthase